jgi:hypothetical protein
MKARLFKLHRWLALLFALPLAVVIVTGQILSFEPRLVTRAVQPGSSSPARWSGPARGHHPEAVPSGRGGHQAPRFVEQVGTAAIQAGCGRPATGLLGPDPAETTGSSWPADESAQQRTVVGVASHHFRLQSHVLGGRRSGKILQASASAAPGLRKFDRVAKK